MKQVFSLMRAYFEQIFLAIDQLVNALIPPLDGTISYADETLSARSYRAWRDGKILGRLTMRPINLLFFWQGPDHCKNAYTKEFDRMFHGPDHSGSWIKHRLKAPQRPTRKK